MDAYLTPDARLALEALAVAAGRTAPAGFLTGHIRGGRFIVEGIVPAADHAAMANPDVFFRLDALTSGRVIGFFFSTTAAAARRPLLRPHACGKLVLAAKRKPSGKLAWEGFSIEFDGKLFFAPARIVGDGKEKP